MIGLTASPPTRPPARSEDGWSKQIEARRPDRIGHLLATATLACALSAGGWAAGRYIARPAPPAQGPAAISSRACGPTCRAAYQAIAEALPHDRDNYLARAILATPGFDYLQLTRALHVPTIARIRAQWRRYCQSRYAGDPRTSAICVRMIDSWRPIPFPAAPGWATS
jgi:hypothetical protein